MVMSEFSTMNLEALTALYKLTPHFANVKFLPTNPAQWLEANEKVIIVNL